jgi:hypothetical protein
LVLYRLHLLATLLGVGTQLTLGNDEGDLIKALRESIQQTTNSPSVAQSS